MWDDVDVGDGSFNSCPIDVGAGRAIKGGDEGFPTSPALELEIARGSYVSLEGRNDGVGVPRGDGEIETETDFGGKSGCDVECDV